MFCNIKVFFFPLEMTHQQNMNLAPQNDQDLNQMGPHGQYILQNATGISEYKTAVSSAREIYP